MLERSSRREIGGAAVFSLDALVTIASRAGLTVELRVRPAKPARHSAAAVR